MGFQRFAGYQGGVGDSTHIHGVIPDERFDSIRSIKGVENVENTDDLDYYE
ncbi:hypothetical protein HY622_04155 [Candidatus Uhrbacteria bacterium]|nr:hypothetical protein [Candidatus Uhrbacteria bacterium]